MGTVNVSQNTFKKYNQKFQLNAKKYIKFTRLNKKLIDFFLLPPSSQVMQ